MICVSTDGVLDRQHDYHWLDTDTVNSTVDTINETVSEALQISYSGSSTLAPRINLGKLALVAYTCSSGIQPILKESPAKLLTWQRYNGACLGYPKNRFRAGRRVLA